MAHAGGRPSKYNKEYLAKTKEYLANYLKLDEVIPTIEGLGYFIGIPRKTIYAWASQETNAEFRGIIEKLQALQGKTLLAKGLQGTFNPTIAKLILHKHGYVEKSETDLTSGGKSLTELLKKAERDERK